MREPSGQIMTTRTRRTRQRTTRTDRNRDLCYRETKSRQFGNLHERMRYAIELLAQHPDLEGSELANALYDLETEVSFHVPATPPYGRRTIPAVETLPTRKDQ